MTKQDLKTKVLDCWYLLGNGDEGWSSFLDEVCSDLPFEVVYLKDIAGDHWFEVQAFIPRLKKTVIFGQFYLMVFYDDVIKQLWKINENICLFESKLTVQMSNK